MLPHNTNTHVRGEADRDSKLMASGYFLKKSCYFIYYLFCALIKAV